MTLRCWVLVEATDSKGEAIHQTLMAKKMARLDELPDFRPFKFRIQAFTNGFLEEVRLPSPARSGREIDLDCLIRTARQ